MRILTQDQAEKIERLAVTGLAKYVKDAGIKNLVLGISGGLDSAVMAVIGLKAIKFLDESDYKCGYTYDFIGIESNPDDLKKARIFAAQSEFQLGEYDYTQWYRTSPIRLTTHEVYSRIRVAKGNLKCRIRMLHLYDRAQLYGGIVLDTDDLSELHMGFWTKHGDVGDVKVIQQLTKDEVRDLGQHFGITRHILGAAPGDGLGVTDSNMASDQLGLEYLKIDYAISKLTSLGFDCNGSNEQLKNGLIRYWISVIAMEIGEAENSVIHVVTQSLKTSYKRVYGDDVANLLPSRLVMGIPEVGSKDFNKTYLAAIKKTF